MKEAFSDRIKQFKDEDIIDSLKENDNDIIKAIIDLMILKYEIK